MYSVASTTRGHCQRCYAVQAGLSERKERHIYTWSVVNIFFFFGRSLVCVFVCSLCSDLN